MSDVKKIENLFPDAVDLLKQLISIPSFSREEDQAAGCLESFFGKKNIPVKRFMNNIWAFNTRFEEGKPTLLLNSHHDTVKPNGGYTLDPFDPIEKDGKLFGLGSNDAGGALVSLAAAFIYYYDRELPFNLIFSATAEEEVSGSNGAEILLDQLPKIDCGIVGEPTLLHMAIAEKGLLVLDGTAHGKAGHAARDEGVNALYMAMKDIGWLSTYRFPRVSPLLGPVHIAVTSVSTPNQAHNMVPSQCSFVTDIRVNELYTFDEILATVRENTVSEVIPRSTRLHPSSLSRDHPLVKAGDQLGIACYGSPTCSDMALMNFPAVKIGPGDSARSHTADEFIFLSEIRDGIKTYIEILENFGMDPGKSLLTTVPGP